MYYLRADRHSGLYRDTKTHLYFDSNLEILTSSSLSRISLFHCLSPRRRWTQDPLGVSHDCSSNLLWNKRTPANFLFSTKMKQMCKQVYVHKMMHGLSKTHLSGQLPENYITLNPYKFNSLSFIGKIITIINLGCSGLLVRALDLRSEYKFWAWVRFPLVDTLSKVRDSQ